MIRSENEYKEAVRRIKDERERFTQHRLKLQADGYSPDEVDRLLEPLMSFHLQLAEEVEAYERLSRGDVGELRNLHELGRMLIGIRIALGLSQRDLAERLDVHESTVSRDERNDYHGITVERASRILDAMRVNVKTFVEPPLVKYEPEDQLAEV